MAVMSLGISIALRSSQTYKTVLIVGGLALTSIIFSQALRLEEFQATINFVQNYFWFYIFFLFAAKTVSIVYPPLPGVVLTLASVPLIGWEAAYLVDITGSVFGAIISYQLGQKYGKSILKTILGEKLSGKILQIKLKQKNQVESAIVLRIAAGGALSDGLAWGASLIGFRLLPFIIGYSVSHVITTLPIFYFVGVSIAFHSWVIVGTAAVIAWFLVYKFKGRYFE